MDHESELFPSWLDYYAGGFVGFDLKFGKIVSLTFPHWSLLLALAILPVLRGWQLLRAAAKRKPLPAMRLRPARHAAALPGMRSSCSEMKPCAAFTYCGFRKKPPRACPGLEHCALASSAIA
jgi:hypothetical protein